MNADLRAAIERIKALLPNLSVDATLSSCCCAACRRENEFHALARNAMPALIAEIETLTLERDAAETELARYRQRAPGMDAGLTLDLGELKEGELG